MTDKFIALVLVLYLIALVGLGLNQAKLTKDVANMQAFRVTRVVVVTPTVTPTATPSATPTLILKKAPLRVVTPVK